MRRLQTLLTVAGLLAAPISAAAGPPVRDPDRPPERPSAEQAPSTPRARLGILVLDLTPELRVHYGVPADRGMLVGRVQPTSPAAAAGIEVGDVLVEIGGTLVDSARSISNALAEVQRAGPRNRFTVRVVRDGKPLVLKVRLGYPGATQSVQQWPRWMPEVLQPFDEDDAPGQA